MLLYKYSSKWNRQKNKQPKINLYIVIFAWIRGFCSTLKAQDERHTDRKRTRLATRGRPCLCVSMWWHRNDWMNLLGICRNVILNQQTIFRMWHSIWSVSVVLSLFLCACFFSFFSPFLPRYFSFSIALNPSFWCLYEFVGLCCSDLWRKWPHSLCFIYFFLLIFFRPFHSSIAVWLIVMRVVFLCCWVRLGPSIGVSFRLAHQLTIEYWTVTQCNLNDDS